MADTDTLEGLMVWVMNRFSEVFGPRAVLKGGMSLRLVDCPRTTNDLDYVFIPYESKKDVSGSILKTLHEIEGAEVKHTLNSKCLRCFVSVRGINLQVEVQVAEECKTTELSTSRLAHENEQQGHIVRVMSFDWALAHKMAAWNERRLMRDLYDIYFMYSIMDVLPDLNVLQGRLADTHRRVPGSSKEKRLDMSLEEFLRDLSVAADDLSPARVEIELRDYMAPDELAGLAMRIRVGLNRLIEKLSGNAAVG